MVRTIRQRAIIRATPDEVYKALTDPVLHAEFTGEVAEGSSEVGGTFSAYTGYITAVNLEMVPGQLIVQKWTTTDWPDDTKPSTLRIELREVDGGTELRMTHSDVPSDTANQYAAGWKEHYWEKLASYFEGKHRKGKVKKG